MDAVQARETLLRGSDPRACARHQAETRLAARVASMPPVAVLAAKEAVNRAFELSLEAGLEFERRNFYLLFASDDQKEGMAAFIEKRSPKWKGR